MTITPDTGYKLKFVKLNGKDVTSGVVNNQYTISNITSDTTLEVEFERITYSLTIKATGNGTVTYAETAVRGKSSAFTISYGNNATISIVPDDGYRIKSVKLNGTDITSTVKNNQYTITDITTNTTIEVVFEQIPNYTISIVSEGNGKVTYGSSIIRNQSKEFTIKEGNSISISFTADSGYRLASVKVNGENKTAQVMNNQLTIENVSVDMTIEVVFEVIPPTTYSFTIKATGNGVLTYDGTSIRGKSSSFTLVDGSYATVTFTPDAGYKIKSVKLNGTDVTSSVKNNQYSLKVESNTTIEVEFEIITYTLTIKATGNGMATYNETTIRGKSSSFSATYGTFAIVIIAPDTGYMIKSVKLNGTDVTSGVVDNKYTISNITANTTLEVVFEHITYTFTIASTGSGTVTYNGTVVRGKSSSFTIEEETKIVVTFAPDGGYRLKSVMLNGKDVTASVINLQYTITSINANTTLEVVFEQIPNYTISIVSEGNGKVTYGSSVIRNQSKEFTIREGNSISISFTPDNGYRLASVRVNGDDVIGQVVNNQLIIENVSVNMAIEVVFETIPVTKYTLTITSSGYGTATYEGTEIRNKTNVFNVAEGTTAVIVITPDDGYRLKSVKQNSVDVSSSVKNNLYSVKVVTNTTIVIEYEADVMEFAVDGLNYKVRSYSEKSARLAKGNYGTTLDVPATCTALNRTWNIVGVESDAFNSSPDLAAIIWNPEVQFSGNVKNPNVLLYVKDKKYAPTSVRNVIVGSAAESITLSDAESGNPFYCPRAFTAQRIAYEHNYSMKSGYQTCQGWETLVLPFNVTAIQQQNGTEIVPREAWVQGSNMLPFWLYTLTALGWRAETTIAANTPYIISMPNNENYNEKYRISGVVQFIGTNVEVKASDNMPVGKNGNKTFVPNYQYLPASANIYALNVNNQWSANTVTEAEGSVFVKNSRPIHPFEAYLTAEGSAAAKRIIPLFDDELPAGISNLTPSLSQGEGAMYDLTGRKIQGELQRGVYIINGNKVWVK